MMFDPVKVVDAALDNPFTEDALALRFSARHVHDLRYVAIRNQWYKWDGTRWAPEPTLLVFDLARASCRNDATDYGNGKPPNKLYTAKTVAAVHWFARADRRQAATIEQFDANQWMLTTENETYDLHTGLGKPPDPSDYISKKTACAAALPGTPHPIFSAFLDRITAGNIELQTFLQRYFGYCLTGETSEHRFIFAYGTGANGKSTLINTIAKIFADYATIADVGTFLAATHERHPTDVAKLHGHRLVIAQETEKGRRWDEVKIKSMTGGDRMTARFMRCDFFDFVPTFKLFITGNAKPRLDNVDEAMRRRLLLVPFTVQIPLAERDPDLPHKLEAEWPAILRWCIDGCLEWQLFGLAPPDIVTEATAAYFDDQDVVRQWLDECTADG
jgi:putative DNA primase/helicase